MFFNTKEKNAICINKEFDYVVKSPKEEQLIKRNPIGWLMPIREDGLYQPQVGIVNFSVPVDDKLYHKIVYLSDIDQGEPDILDNRDNNKIRKIIKKNFFRKYTLTRPNVFNNDEAFDKILNCKLFDFIRID